MWIKHDLTPRQKLAVNALGEHALQFLNEERRVYPKGNLFAHVVGFVNSDDKGMAGIEAGLEKRLRGDATPVRLSVDSRVQFILRSEIVRQMAAFDAKRGFGLVMNVRNGEVLALTSMPDFDPNNLTAASADELYNHATFGVYEMGSVFKIFNTAMLLSSGLATMETKFDATNPDPYRPLHHSRRPSATALADRGRSIPIFLEYRLRQGSLVGRRRAARRFSRQARPP